MLLILALSLPYYIYVSFLSAFARCFTVSVVWEILCQTPWKGIKSILNAPNSMKEKFIQYLIPHRCMPPLQFPKCHWQIISWLNSPAMTQQQKELNLDFTPSMRFLSSSDLCSSRAVGVGSCTSSRNWRATWCACRRSAVYFTWSWATPQGCGMPP